MQKLHPTPGLLNQNLHFNEIPCLKICILTRLLHNKRRSAAALRDFCLQSQVMKAKFISLAGIPCIFCHSLPLPFKRQLELQAKALFHKRISRDARLPRAAQGTSLFRQILRALLTKKTASGHCRQASRKVSLPGERPSSYCFALHP